MTLCGIGALGLHESRQLSASIQEPPPEEPPLTPAFAGASTSGASEEYRPEVSETGAPRGSAPSSKPFGVATFITGRFASVLASPSWSILSWDHRRRFDLRTV